METLISTEKIMEIHEYIDGKPCSHPGCLNHVTHPCEGCGRIGGMDMETILIKKIKSIQEEYAEAIKPYMSELIKLRGMRTSPLVMVLSIPFPSDHKSSDKNDDNLQSLPGELKYVTS